jgi:hypothetical protein
LICIDLDRIPQRDVAADALLDEPVVPDALVRRRNDVEAVDIGLDHEDAGDHDRPDGQG